MKTVLGRLLSIKRQTRDTVTFRFPLPGNARLNAKPGQFLTFDWFGPVLMFCPSNVATERVHNIAVSFRDLLAMHLANQNVNVSSSAIMITGGPPDDIFTA